jgi:hypothetical protein
VPRRNDEDEAPRRNDEGRLDAKAERRLSRRQLGPRSATHHADLGARAAAVAGSPQVVRISGIQESEFPEPTERELARKEKALAEAAALLVLKKKVETLYGEGEDDDTDEENEK